MKKTVVKPHILESISEGVFTVDHEWRITSFNRAAEEITGTPRNDAIGSFCWEIFHSNLCKGNCALRRTMKEGRFFSGISVYIHPKNKKRIPISVSTALLYNDQGEILGGVETFRDNTLVEELRQELNGSLKQGDMVSRSPLMIKIFSVLTQIAESDSTVLIEGDTGTGKEMLAKALHDQSKRREKPFIAINCGALPDTLLESELFGYKAGAFTDAVTDKPGYFAMADGGTIMLDELGETSPAFQAKLLRVLEEREFQPLGGVQKQHVNVRVLAATNQDLEALIEQGRFRQDLLYRINIVRLQLPALRERKEDIPLLIERFFEQFTAKHKRRHKRMSAEALQLCQRFPWPGNVRQLRNVIERVVITCREVEAGVSHLPDFLRDYDQNTTTFTVRPGTPLAEVEKLLIRQTLTHVTSNREAAARALGISRRALQYKLKHYGLLEGSAAGEPPAPPSELLGPS